MCIYDRGRCLPLSFGRRGTTYALMLNTFGMSMFLFLTGMWIISLLLKTPQQPFSGIISGILCVCIASTFALCIITFWLSAPTPGHTPIRCLQVFYMALFFCGFMVLFSIGAVGDRDWYERAPYEVALCMSTSVLMMLGSGVGYELCSRSRAFMTEERRQEYWPGEEWRQWQEVRPEWAAYAI